MSVHLADCRFCNLPETEVVHRRKHAIVIVPFNYPDEYLIVPTSHAEEPNDLDPSFWADAMAMDAHLTATEERLEGSEYGHDRNLSLNIGRIAGQTISHLHLWRTRRRANTPSATKGLVTLRNAYDGLGS